MDTLTIIATVVSVILFIYVILDAYNTVSDNEQPAPSLDTIPDADNK